MLSMKKIRIPHSYPPQKLSFREQNGEKAEKMGDLIR